MFKNLFTKYTMSFILFIVVITISYISNNMIYLFIYLSMKDQLMISYEGLHVCQIELIEDTENGDEFVYYIL